MHVDPAQAGLAALTVVVIIICTATPSSGNNKHSEQCRRFFELALIAVQNHPENAGVVIVALASMLTTVLQGNSNNYINLDVPEVVRRTLAGLDMLEGNLFDKVVPIVAPMLWWLIMGGTSTSSNKDKQSLRNPRIQKHLCTTVGHLIRSKSTNDATMEELSALGDFNRLVQTIRHNVAHAGGRGIQSLDLIQRLQPQQQRQQQQQDDHATGTRITRTATENNLQPLLVSTLIFTDATTILQYWLASFNGNSNKMMKGAATIANMAYQAWTRLYAAQTSVVPAQQDSDNDDDCQYDDDDGNDDDSVYF